jgi:hypothetical protein
MGKYWRAEAVKAKSVPVADVGKHRRHRASRSKWCKGIEGRKHELEWVADPTRSHYPYVLHLRYILRCKNCGKHMASCSGSYGEHPEGAPPCPIHGS